MHVGGETGVASAQPAAQQSILEPGGGIEHEQRPMPGGDLRAGRLLGKPDLRYPGQIGEGGNRHRPDRTRPATPRPDATTPQPVFATELRAMARNSVAKRDVGEPALGCRR